MSEHNPYWKEEIVLTAAIFIDDGKKHPNQPFNIVTGLVVTGHRHHNCFATIYALGIDYKSLCKNSVNVQGFITTKNRFLSRDAAGKLAYTTGQRTEIVHLFSEDLY